MSRQASGHLYYKLCWQQAAVKLKKRFYIKYHKTLKILLGCRRTNYDREKRKWLTRVLIVLNDLRSAVSCWRFLWLRSRLRLVAVKFCRASSNWLSIRACTRVSSSQYGKQHCQKNLAKSVAICKCIHQMPPQVQASIKTLSVCTLERQLCWHAVLGWSSEVSEPWTPPNTMS